MAIENSEGRLFSMLWFDLSPHVAGAGASIVTPNSGVRLEVVNFSSVYILAITVCKLGGAGEISRLELVASGSSDMSDPVVVVSRELSGVAGVGDYASLECSRYQVANAGADLLYVAGRITQTGVDDRAAVLYTRLGLFQRGNLTGEVVYEPESMSASHGVLVASSGGDYSSIGAALAALEPLIVVAGESFDEDVTVSYSCEIVTLPGFRLLAGASSGDFTVSALATDGVVLDVLGESTIDGDVTWPSDDGCIRGRNNLSVGGDLVSSGNGFSLDGGGVGSVFSREISISGGYAEVARVYVDSNPGSGASDGIDGSTCDDWCVRGCVVADCEGNGFGNGLRGILSGNWVFDADDRGVYVTDDDGVVSGNFLKGTPSVGVVDVDGGDDNVVSSNVANGAVTVSSSGSDSVLVYGNRTDGAVSDSGTGTLLAGNNEVAY